MRIVATPVGAACDRSMPGAVVGISLPFARSEVGANSETVCVTAPRELFVITPATGSAFVVETLPIGRFRAGPDGRRGAVGRARAHPR
jgi:hypothetical protein